MFEEEVSLLGFSELDGDFVEGAGEEEDSKVLEAPVPPSCLVSTNSKLSNTTRNALRFSPSFDSHWSSFSRPSIKIARPFVKNLPIASALGPKLSTSTKVVSSFRFPV